MRRPGLLIATALVLIMALSAAADETLLDAARRSIAAGDLPGAEQKARQALQADPDSAEAHYLLGNILLMSEQPDEGLVELERAVQLDPGHADAHRFAAMALLNKGDLAGARRHLERAIELEPNKAKSYVDLGIVLQLSGDSDGALDNLLKAKQLNPKQPDLQRNLGIIYVTRGQWPQAEAELIPLAATPGGQSAEIQYLAGFTLFNLDRQDDAQRHFLRSLELEADHAMPHYFLGLIALSRGEMRQGETE